MLSGVRRALLARLVKLPENEVDEALRLMGVEVGAIRHLGGSTVEFKPIGDLTGLGFPVPVFPFSLVGTSHDAWPAIGVYPRNILPRQSNFVYRDPIYRDVAGTKRTITFPDGSTITRANLRKRRPHPLPFDLRFEIRIESRHETEMALIAEKVYDLLGFKGFLEVTLRSGEQVTYDTEIEEPVAAEVPEGVVEEGDVAEHTLILPFVVEAYADNSEAEELVRIIHQRELQGTNQNETDPITAWEPDVVDDP